MRRHAGADGIAACLLSMGAALVTATVLTSAAAPHPAALAGQPTAVPRTSTASIRASASASPSLQQSALGPSQSRAAAPRSPGDATLAPDALEIPSLDRRFALVRSRVQGGEVTVPADPRAVGHYWPSGELGTGVAVLVGHLDWGGRPGAFADIGGLRPGDEIRTRIAGRSLAWRVRWRATYTRGRLPAQVFSVGGDPGLALVTCAGPIRAGEYTRNLVVWADPVA